QGIVRASSFTQTILTVLVLGAGTDYGLFLTLRMREELERGLSPRDAVRRAVERVGESITFSAGTVIVALLSLTFATFAVYAGLGPSLAIGVALMLLAALTLLPALLATLGRAVFWPLKLTLPTAATGRREARSGAPRGSWGTIAVQVVRRPALTLLLGMVLFGALSLAVLAYAPAGFGGTTTGPTGSDSANGTAAIAAHFPAAVAQPTTIVLRFPYSVWTHLSGVQQAEGQLAAAHEFASVSGPLNPNGTAIDPRLIEMAYARFGPPQALPATPPAAIAANIPASTYQAYRALGQFISADGRTVQFYTTLEAGVPTSSQALHAIPDIRAATQRIAQNAGATESGVVGQAAASYDVSNASDADLAHIVPVVLALIALLLAVVMRSLVTPLYLVASVALSFFASLGLAVLIFMRAGGQAGLNFVLPFLMFIFLMALGEDYNILVMSRIREEAQHRRLSDAIAHALGATGTTVTSAGLILAATFAVAGFAYSSDQIRQLTISIALGVLLDTFLVRTLLVPSVVALLGRWNWWPSSLSRRQRQQGQPAPASASEDVVAV
ncbi:MAG TPA: MMPL family transporter, partial [Ktedonobacterales bacterium]